MTTGAALSLGKLQFTPHQLHCLSDWQKFEEKIKELALPVNFGEKVGTALTAAEAINKQIQSAIDVTVRWLKPSTTPTKWLTPDISKLKKQLKRIGKTDRPK